jgi:predicted dehydrogenase
MRIGLVGFGFMGGVHLSAIEQTEGAVLTAVCSRTRPTADSPPRGNLPQATTATLAPEVRWYSDWRDLLQDPDVDAVDVCLPTHLHKQVVLSALERGKHVLCEKPMALTASDCDEMVEAARRSGRIFMVAQVLRFMFPYCYAGSFIHSLSADSVEVCRLQRKTGYPQWSEWLAKEQYSGGATLDLLIHDIDQALKFFGKPDSVTAVSRGEIDTMLGKLRYRNGLEVQIEGGWYAPDLPFSAGFEIIGKDGRRLSFEAGKLQQLDRQGRADLIETPDSLGYQEQMAYFVSCCSGNTAPDLCPPAESAQAVKIALLLKASRDQNGRELSC